MTVCIRRLSSTQSDKYQVSHWYSNFSWWWAHRCPKHVEKRNKYTRKTVHQVGFIHLVEITNKMQPCIRIYYSTVHWRLNMFRAAYPSSSGALTVFAASGLHTHVVTGRSQVWVGTQVLFTILWDTTSEFAWGDLVGQREASISRDELLFDTCTKNLLNKKQNCYPIYLDCMLLTLHHSQFSKRYFDYS